MKKFTLRIVGFNHQEELRKLAEVLNYLSNYVPRGVVVTEVKTNVTLTVVFLAKDNDCDFIIGMKSRFQKTEIKEVA